MLFNQGGNKAHNVLIQGAELKITYPSFLSTIYASFDTSPGLTLSPGLLGLSFRIDTSNFSFCMGIFHGTNSTYLRCLPVFCHTFVSWIAESEPKFGFLESFRKQGTQILSLILNEVKWGMAS